MFTDHQKNDQTVIPTDKSPFINKLATIIREGKRPIGYQKVDEVIDEIDGKKNLVATTHYKETVDKSEFIMIYSQGVRALTGMPKAGMKAMQAIMDVYISGPVNSDRIYLRYHDAVKNYGYRHSMQHWQNGINALIAESIIAKIPKHPSWYFINPAYIFRGNRYRIVEEYVLNDEEKTNG